MFLEGLRSVARRLPDEQQDAAFESAVWGAHVLRAAERTNELSEDRWNDLEADFDALTRVLLPVLRPSGSQAENSQSVGERLREASALHGERRSPPALVGTPGMREPTPRQFPPLPPLVDLTATEETPDGRRVAIDNLIVNRDGAELRLPMVTDFEPNAVFSFGSFSAALAEAVTAVGPIGYERILYVYGPGDELPDLVIAAETSEVGPPATPEDDSVDEPQPPFLCIVYPGGRKNLGPHPACSSPDEFCQVAVGLAAGALGYEGSEYGVEKDPLQRLESILALAMDARDKGLDGQAMSILLELSDATEDTVFSSFAARVSMELARCERLTGLHSVAAARLVALVQRERKRGHWDNAAAANLELARSRYLGSDVLGAEDALRDSLEVKTEGFERVHVSGLATYTEPFNADLAGELHLLGHLLGARGDATGAIEILRIGSEVAGAQNSFKLQAAIELELALVQMSAACWKASAEALLTALELGALDVDDQHARDLIAVCLAHAYALLEIDDVASWTATLQAWLSSPSGERAAAGSDSIDGDGLEVAVVRQLFETSESLLAGMLLMGRPVKASLWDHLTRARNNAAIELATSVPTTVDEYISEFGDRVKERELLPKSSVALHETQISNGSERFHLSDAGRLNKRLRWLGSAYRLVYVGEQSSWIARTIRALTFENDVPAVDPRFVFGRLGAVSAVPFARLFDFTNELAISPAMDDDAPAFTHGRQIVLRRACFPHAEANDADSAIDHALVHETVHTVSGSSKRKLSYAPTGWTLDTIADVKRLATSPIAVDALRKGMTRNFDHPMLRPHEVEGLPDFGVQSGVDLRDLVSQGKFLALVDYLVASGQLRRDPGGAVMVSS